MKKLEIKIVIIPVSVITGVIDFKITKIIWEELLYL